MTTDESRTAPDEDGTARGSLAGPVGGGVAVVGERRPRRVQDPVASRRAERAGEGLEQEPDEGDPRASASGPSPLEAGSADKPGSGRRTDGPRTARTVRRSAFLAALAAAVLCALAAIGFGLAWANLEGTQQATSQVEAVSRAFVLDLTNLTPQTVDQRITDLLAASTGSFANQARSFFDSGNPPVRDALISAKAVEQGQIRSLAVEQVNGSTASSFAVVDVSYTNDKLSSPQSDVLRLQLDLVKTAAGWRVSNVTVLDGATGGVLQTPGSGG
ncbi:hypothetical protein ACFFRE_02835 [Aciditerrimonas ferrireducens]|jgi:hypothetical protein|uniref:Mce-associated membrane protein n=1 Tax=Aciditerrimonas ferrireducens TaxID=667306 RepID=A0ABV6C082_9ACTN